MHIKYTNLTSVLYNIQYDGALRVDIVHGSCAVSQYTILNCSIEVLAFVVCLEKFALNVKMFYLTLLLNLTGEVSMFSATLLTSAVV